MSASAGTSAGPRGGAAELARGTWIVLRAELWRLARSRAAWAALLVVMAAAAARAASSAHGLGAERASLASGGAWPALADGWRVGLVLGALVLAAGGARALAADLEQGLARLALVRSASRGALLLGRAALGPICVLALWAGSGLAACAAAAALHGFGPLVDEGYTLMRADEAFRELRLAALAVLPALLATWILGLCIGALAASAAGAVAAALGLLLAFDLLKGDLLGPAAEWIFAAHAPTLLDSSAFRGLGELLRGYSDAPATGERLRAALLVPLPQALILLALARLALARRRL